MLFPISVTTAIFVCSNCLITTPEGVSHPEQPILNYSCPFTSLGCLGSETAILANKANEQYLKTSKLTRSRIPQRWEKNPKTKKQIPPHTHTILARILVYNPPAFLLYYSYSILVPFNHKIISTEKTIQKILPLLSCYDSRTSPLLI